MTNPLKTGAGPTVSYLFRTVAQALGKNAMGILLTGMGRDGAMELKSMKESGAVTIIQDEESSLVFGMPGEALKLDAGWVMSPAEISRTLSGICLKN